MENLELAYNKQGLLGQAVFAQVFVKQCVLKKVRS